ncbi:MAG: exodeoxyribonuclease V subunit gamma [Acidimicrobiales bacterium]
MLHIHRAERADHLVEGLGDLVSEPLDDAMESEVVAVPARGVERWLTQRLATRLGVTPGRADGVCANLAFPFPGHLVGGAIAAATGVDGDADPWRPERSVWPLLDVVDASLAEAWLAPLATHLGGAETDGDDGRRARRFTAVRHVADLYDRYGVHRPQMLRAWAVGEDTDGAGRPLVAGGVWQAELWRRLRTGLDQPSPAERLEEACVRLRAAPSLSDLPRRLSLFGLTRLPASYLDVLRALAVGRDVHLFLLHPSPVLWSRIADQTQHHAAVGRRVDDPTTRTGRNALLASWGRDAREMQLVLTAGERAGDAVQADHHHPFTEEPATLLQRVQADVRADRSPPGAPLPDLDDARAFLQPGDRSIQVHSCHGRARQVEVVRDAILHLLSDDPSLEARDVIVMCPDIETFAPLVHATFGAADSKDGAPDAGRDDDAPDGPGPPDLRVRLADRSLRQTNPVLATVSELLALVDARLTTSQVIDLAGRDPVRRRFALDDEDLSRIEEWVAATGVRWGLDAAHRAPFKLEYLDANTWRFGLDRVLVGVTMADEGQRLVGGVLPLDDVDSSAIDLVGRFAELIDRLHACFAALCGPQPIAAWASAIVAAVDSLTATSGTDAWQTAQLQRVLDEVVSEATQDGTASAADLALPEVRALLADRLRGRPTRANFRTGHLTVCTLVPMRSVPHRIVCLLGLDDGSFPRRTSRDGDDLILDEPHVGDRDARSEDRQLLLDALLAATDHLVITYSGRDERTNAERPPAVPVGELLDVIDRTVQTMGPSSAVDSAGIGESAPAALPARRQVVVHHPLQPFDGRNFTLGRVVADRAWSFDRVALDGARALAGPRTQAPPFVAGPLPAPGGAVVELSQLVAFAQHPVRAFLRQRLGVTAHDWSENLSDELPIELDGLGKWGVGERLLHARLAGADPEAGVAAEIARGLLPPGELAGAIFDEVGPTVEKLVAAAGAVRTGDAEPGSVELNLHLADGRLLIGTVPGLAGNLLRGVTYSRVGPKHRLAAWVHVLALTASRPERPWASATVGRRRDGANKRCSVTVASIAPFEGAPAVRRELAQAHLDRLIELYDRGMCEPLPLYCATSGAYAAAIAAGRSPEAAAAAGAGAWTSGKIDKEDKDPAHVLVLGGVRSFSDVLDAPPGHLEQGGGWAADEPTRFGRSARRLWDGLVSCEHVADQ